MRRVADGVEDDVAAPLLDVRDHGQRQRLREVGAGDAGAKLAFCESAYRQLLPPDLPALAFDDSAAFADFLDAGPFTPVEPGPDTVAIQPYTSGSTGKPKGVLLSHASQRWSLETSARTYGERPHHRYIVAAPMFHMNATISVKGALAAGGSIVLMPSFDARKYAQAVARFGVTWLTSVPTMLALMAREGALVGGLDFSSVTNVTMGSAPLTQALVDKVQAIFPGALINNSYGTTEAGPSPFGPHPSGIPRPETSLGYPLPGALSELREGPDANHGVLYMKNPMRMEGYNKLPAKT